MSRKPVILCVDDEPNVLAGLQLVLRRRFMVSLAEGGEQALALIDEADPPFEVIISDMRMPGMDGAAFLTECVARTPDSTRMLLTGQADLDAAIRTVNEGQLFRFLTKPCPPKDLVAAIHAGVEQHRLITAERVLLEQTLRGTIRTLTEILSLSHPEAFGRAGQLKRWAGLVSPHVEGVSPWILEVAAMLSQIGTVGLPVETSRKIFCGEALDDAEKAMVAKVPAITRKLLAPIPRLEPVVAVLDGARLRFDGRGTPQGMPTGPRIPVEGRLLHAVMDFDRLLVRLSPDQAAERMRKYAGSVYDPEVLEATLGVLLPVVASNRTREVDPWDLLPGMILAKELRTSTGALLLASGTEITAALVDRLQHAHARVGVEMVVVALD